MNQSTLFWILVLALIFGSGGATYYGQPHFGYGFGSVLVLLIFLKIFGVI